MDWELDYETTSIAGKKQEMSYISRSHVFAFNASEAQGISFRSELPGTA
jgi:hypothetical protein